MTKILNRQDFSLTNKVDLHILNLPDDSLVAICQRVDCGSLFKTFRLVSRVWKKHIEAAHPTGDEKFADNVMTLMYLNEDFHNTSLVKWVFRHNIEINANIVKKITRGFARCFSESDDVWSVVIVNYFIDCVKTRLFPEFVESVVWKGGVLRLTPKSFDYILKSDHKSWNFPRIYKHIRPDRYDQTQDVYYPNTLSNPPGVPEQDQRSFDASPNTTCTGVPWPTTRALIDKFGPMRLVKLCKIYSNHEELMELGSEYGLGKIADKELVLKLSKSKPWTKSLAEIEDNPNLTLEIALEFKNRLFSISSIEGITLQTIQDHPEIDWTHVALYKIKITDENIDEILNHPLLSVYILTCNESVTVQYARMIAKKLAEVGLGLGNQVYGPDISRKVQENAGEIFRTRFIITPYWIPEVDVILDAYSDWNGLAKTLSWKVMRRIQNVSRLKYIGRSTKYSRFTAR